MKPGTWRRLIAMRSKDFMEWMEADGLGKNTARSRLTNCWTVEDYQHVNLDDQYDRDRCKQLITLFTYTADDERARREPCHQVPINGNIRNGSAAYKAAINKYVKFRDSETEEAICKKITQGRCADKTTSGHGELGEFKNVVREFHQWLIDEAHLTENSADQYKVYIKKLCAEVDKELGTGWFESLPMDPQKWESISAFIEKRVRTAKGDKDRKSWNDWRSAFHRFEEFLEITDVWDIQSTEDDLTEEPVQTKPISSSSCVIEKSVKNDANDENEEVVATYNHEELVHRFRSRLTTQNRYYPRFNLLFPTRLLTKIFKRSRPNAWEQWLEKGIENIGILKESGDKVLFSKVAGFEFLRNGTVIVTKRDGETFKMMTRTANGSVREERTERGLRDVSIDHITPLENVLRENKGSFVGLNKLTTLFSEFNKTAGRNFDERDEKDWVNVFFEAYRDELDGKDMRDAFVEYDLKILKNLKYELMDRKENTRKGKRN